MRGDDAPHERGRCRGQCRTFAPIASRPAHLPPAAGPPADPADPTDPADRATRALLARPVTLASVMGPAAGVRYSEVAGVAVLYDPVGRTVHQLSPAAARLWHRLDGRTLDDASGADGDGRAAIELARRLRALGLLVDRPAGAGPSPPATDRPATVSIPGRLRPGDAGPTLEVDPTEGAPTVTLDGSTYVPRGGVVPVAALAVSDTAAVPEHPHGVEALAVIAEQLPPSWFAPIDALDQLADLVEAIPVVAERAP